jgi:REP element-mobilizing transposase RayT
LFAAEAAPTVPGGANRRRFHSRDLRRGRHSCAGQIYLVTTVTHGRERLLDDLANARAVVHALRRASEQQSARTLAYVVMPDHLHWLLALGEKHALSAVVGRIKGESARRINLLRNHCGGPVWQHGFHDHALRAEEDILDMARYVVANPLRAGLVSRIGNYPWWDAEWI